LSSVTTILPFSLVIFIIAIGVVLLNLHFQKNLYKEKENQEELKRLHEIEILKSSIRIQEEERKRIAQDIHDDLGAVLSIARMHLKVLEQNIARELTDNTLDSVKNLCLLVENAITSVRNISHQLMPSQLEKYGLVKTLETIVEQINKANKISIHFDSQYTEQVFSWEINVGLYRIIIELINNTIKHANASHIYLQIQISNSQVECFYHDDGTGIDNNLASDGIGLKSIQGRVNSLNGIIEYGNEIKKGGFYANITIPF